MNWRVSSLDGYRLVSNSDAHSPPMLGREATAFELPETDYWAKLRESGLIDAEKTDDEIREEVSSQGGSVQGINDLPGSGNEGQ